MTPKYHARFPFTCPLPCFLLCFTTSHFGSTFLVVWTLRLSQTRDPNLDSHGDKDARRERIGEVVIVLLVGVMLTRRFLPFDALWFVPVLLLVIRPVSVWLGLLGTRTQRRLIAWFGGRGSGSIYHLMYAIEHGLTGRPPSG